MRALVECHGRCQLCGKPGRWVTYGRKVRRGKVLAEGERRMVGVTFHHIVPRSQRGDDVPENGLVVCGSGTTGCHGDLEARKPDTRCLARAYMTPAQEQYVVAKKSAAWLETNYPLVSPVRVDRPLPTVRFRH